MKLFKNWTFRNATSINIILVRVLRSHRHTYIPIVTFRFVPQTAEYMTLVTVPQPDRPGQPLSTDQPLFSYIFLTAFCDTNKNIFITYEEAEVPSTENFP